MNDVLRAKCEAPIRLEVIDCATGQPVTEDIPGAVIEMCVLDGNQYDARCSERPGEERIEDLEACALLLNNKASALLVPGAGGSLNGDNKVIVSLSKGVAALPDLHISDSSEALLSGRKPPFRLLARIIPSPNSTGPESNPEARNVVPRVRCAISEGFVVATRRTRTAGKVDIPNVDDHVGKLEHMGRETVKKLQDIRGSALAAGIDIQVPDNCINKVGEFRKLALLAEADGHLRQKLQQVLKLSKEKWDEARDHAMRAVVADNRMRIWYADKGSMDVGLLFTCRLGSVELDRPVGLLTKKASDGAQTTMEATLMAQQTPTQRDQVRSLQPQAAASWWQGGHPGWAIYPVDSDQFLATGALDQAVLPNSGDQILSSLPSVAAGGGGGGGGGGAFPFVSAFGPPGQPTPIPSFSNDALLRAIGAGAYLGSPSPGGGVAAGGGGMNSAFGMAGLMSGYPGMQPNPTTSTSPFATIQQQASQGGGPSLLQQPQHAQQHAYRNPTMSPSHQRHASERDGGLGMGPQAQSHTAFQPSSTSDQPGDQQQQQQQRQQIPHHLHQQSARQQSLGRGNAVDQNGGSAPQRPSQFDLASSLGLGNLQSLLAGDLKMPSSGPGGAYSIQNFPSLPGGGTLPGSGDLESLLAAHGGLDPVLAGGRFPSLAFGKSLELFDGGYGTTKENGGGGGALQRRQSGLDNMQSIEHALTDSQRPQSVHDAIDAAVAAVGHQEGDADQGFQRSGLAGTKRK